MVKLPLHKTKALTHLKMHSMMVLKKSNDNLHLKLGKDVMISLKTQSTIENTSGSKILFLSPIVLGVARLMLQNEVKRKSYIW